MTRRFEGAITTPTDAPDSAKAPGATRPRRPLSIEISSAILIVGGLLATLGTMVAATADVAGPDDPGARAVSALLLILNVLTVVVGVVVRRGAAWILCINVVAIALFVELTAVPGGGAYVAVLAALDAFVFVALLRNRAWFDWRAAAEDRAR
jgi:hypothetical protein